MNHIDEGTIHAWIDGALSAERAREVEAHVAQCATCSASVVEARGLVAASSRILSALDDVPANVTPKKPATAPKAPKRQWRAARWVTGIAALLLAAVVLRTSRDVPREMQKQAATVAPPAALPEVRRTPEPAHEIAIKQPPRIQSNVPRTSAPVASLGDRAATAGAGGAAAQSASLVDTSRRRDMAKSLAQAEASQRAAVDAEAQRRADVANRDRAADVVAPIAPQPSPLLRVPAPINSVPALADSAFAGCYVMIDERKGLMNVAATAAEVAVRVRGAAKAPASAPAAAPMRESAPSASLFLQLDTVVQTSGYLARDAKTGASVGWWRRTAADSVKVSLLNGGVVAVRHGDKKACPER